MPTPCFKGPSSMVVILLTLSVISKTQSFFYPRSQKAVISPVDVVVFFGETLKVYCNLTTADYSASQIYFKITAGSHISLIKDNIVVVDKTSVYTEVNITEATHVGRTTYECKAGQETLKSILIYAEYPLQNVSDFRGVYLYNKKTLLTWKLGVDYLVPNKVVVAVDWNAYGTPNLSGTISDEQTKESATIRYTGETTIYIRINVSLSRNRPSPELVRNALPASAVSVHKLILPDIMKTAAASNFTVASKTSRCFKLTWKDPDYFIDFNASSTYQIQIKKEAEDGAQFETVIENNVRPVELCKLEPYTCYKLTLSVKALEKNPWSDPVKLISWTNEDRPGEGPPLTSTSYHTEECYNNKREFSLYWNKPTTSSLHGELTNYKVKYADKEVLLRSGSNNFRVKLNCNTSYDFSVFSSTKIGESLSPSMIHIPAEKDTLQVPANFDFKVEENFQSDISVTQKNVTVSWNSSQLQDKDVSLILYMCKENYIGQTCFDDFKTVKARVSKNEIFVSNLSVDIDLFGYALMSSSGNRRGIRWTDCVFHSESKLKKLDVKVSTGRNSLLVTWTASRCNKKDKILILEYKLIACKGEPLDSEKKHCTEYVIDSRAGTIFELKNLQAHQQYYVYVQSVSYAGDGAVSDPVKADVAGSQEESDMPVIATIMLTLIGVIFLGGIIYALWKCKRSKNYFENLMQQGSESMDGYVNLTLQVYSQASSESGFYSKSFRPPHIPPLPKERLHNPSRGCFPVSNKEADTLLPAHILPVSDFQDPVAITPKENVVMKSENNSINPNGYLKITNTNLISQDSTSSAKEENVSPSDHRSVNETETTSDIDGYLKWPNQLMTNSSGPENLVITSQISVDEGFISPKAESTKEEPKFLKDIHGHQVQPTNDVPQGWSIMKNPHSDRRVASRISLQPFPSQSMSSEDSNPNECPVTISSKVCSNTDTVRDHLRTPLEMSEVHDLHLNLSDFSSNSSDYRQIDAYSKFGIDIKGYHSSVKEIDGQDSVVFSNGKQSQCESDGYKSQSFIESHQNVPSDTTPQRLMENHQNVPSNGYKSHSFVENHQNGHKPQSFMENCQDVQSDGYKSQSFMEQHQDVPSDSYKPQGFMENSQDAQSDGYKSQSFMEKHQGIPSDGYKSQSFMESHQNVPSHTTPQSLM